MLRLFTSTLCAALVLVVSGAHAYCRTTTSHAPAGYNPAVSGCWTGGTALSWRVDRVPYAVSSSASRQVSLAEATRVADLAFQSWTGATCGGQALGVEAYDDGPIATPTSADGTALATWAQCAYSSGCDPGAHDVIVFDDDGWPYNDPVNTLALTTVTFGVNDGQIFQAYTEVNSAQHTLTTTEPPQGGAAFDLQTILTHEAGHFLGLAHATDTGAVMYAYYQPGAVQLAGDDIQGICAVYPPGSNAPPAGKCSCIAAGAGSSTPSGVAATLAFALFAALRTRRRRRCRRAL